MLKLQELKSHKGTTCCCDWEKNTNPKFNSSAFWSCGLWGCRKLWLLRWCWAKMFLLRRPGTRLRLQPNFAGRCVHAPTKALWGLRPPLDCKRPRNWGHGRGCDPWKFSGLGRVGQKGRAMALWDDLGSNHKEMWYPYCGRKSWRFGCPLCVWTQQETRISWCSLPERQALSAGDKTGRTCFPYGMGKKLKHKWIQTMRPDFISRVRGNGGLTPHLRAKALWNLGWTRVVLLRPLRFPQQHRPPN